MSNDFFELYTYDVEYIEEVQAFRTPRIDGIDGSRFGVWRVFERSHEWLRPSDKRYKQRKVGNDK
jgi:hypothetical protein